MAKAKYTTSFNGHMLLARRQVNAFPEGITLFPC